MKTTLAAAICLFWLGMTGWLVDREILPTLRKPPSITYRTLLARTVYPHVDCFAIGVAGAPVGTLEAEYRRAGDGNGSGFEVTNRLRVRPGLAPAWVLGGMSLPSLGEIKGSWTVRLDARYQPVHLHLDAEAPAVGLERFEAQGWFKDNLFLTYRVNGEPPRPLNLPFPRGTLFGTGIGWIGTVGDLVPGKSWNMTTVDVLGSLMARAVRTQEVTCTVTEAATRRIGTETVAGFLVKARTGTGEATLFFSASGELMQAHLPGLEIVRTF